MARRVMLYATPLAVLLVALVTSAAPAGTSVRCHLKWRGVPSPRFSDVWTGRIDAVGRGDVWVANTLLTTTISSGPVLVEHWNGRQWRAGRLAFEASGQLSLSASSSRDVWIVGETPETKPLLLHYDGQGWTSVPAPSAPDEFDLVHDVVALAPNDAWVVGQTFVRGVDGERALILHWNGSGWTRVDAPPGFQSLGGLAALSPHDIWAVAPAQEDPAVGLRVIVAHWDGTSWRRVDTTLPAVDLIRLRAGSATDLWAVGSTSGTARRGVVVHWNGHAFRLVREMRPFGTDSFPGVAAAARQAWAVGFEDIEHWDGRRWQRTHISGVSFADADALSPRNVWAIGGNRRGPAIYHYACR